MAGRVLHRRSEVLSRVALVSQNDAPLLLELLVDALQVLHLRGVEIELPADDTGEGLPYATLERLPIVRCSASELLARAALLPCGRLPGYRRFGDLRAGGGCACHQRGGDDRSCRAHDAPSGDEPLPSTRIVTGSGSAIGTACSWSIWSSSACSWRSFKSARRDVVARPAGAIWSSAGATTLAVGRVLASVSAAAPRFGRPSADDTRAESGTAVPCRRTANEPPPTASTVTAAAMRQSDHTRRRGATRTGRVARFGSAFTT